MLHIIIPTLNAASHLPNLLKAIPRDDPALRVIVADGGSTDATLPVAASFNASLAVGASGRGAQLRLGAGLAILSGSPADWFLFLHADSQLPGNWQPEIARAMTFGSPRYFRYKAASSGWRARLVSALVNFRSAGWGLPYGDQGLLISRADYVAIGGYRPMPLFEDVDIVDRLPQLAPLPIALTTDVGSYEDQGFFARGRRNLRLLKRYRSGENVEQIIKDYYS